MTTTPTDKSRVVLRSESTNWPDLFTPPRSPFRAFAAERLFRYAVRSLPVQVLLPDGTRLGAGGPDSPRMRLVRPAAFFHRLGVDAKIGFGESYMVGDWTTDDDLADLLTPFAAKIATLVPPPLQALRRFVDRRPPRDDRNTVDGSRRNIQRHYDLSNDLFAAFLDETMTYSSAWFETPDQDLADAQRNKIDGVLDYAGVREGSKVLEIGTGWGAAAIRAAQRGAQVTSITISLEQQRLAQERVREAGLEDRVTVELCDYRDATGQYDAVISVEMIEAVGREYWPTYFAALDRLLVPGGKVGLQGITMPDNRMKATTNSYTWIHKYIFPGGQCPSIPSIERNLRDHTSLRIAERRTLGTHYAHTLQVWRERFLGNWAHISTLGFDETFQKLWEFYLAYSEAGFRSGYLDVWQLSMAKPAA